MGDFSPFIYPGFAFCTPDLDPLADLSFLSQDLIKQVHESVVSGCLSILRAMGKEEKSGFNSIVIRASTLLKATHHKQYILASAPCNHVTLSWYSLFAPHLSNTCVTSACSFPAAHMSAVLPDYIQGIGTGNRVRVSRQHVS